MIVYLCDTCKRDITQDNHYLVTAIEKHVDSGDKINEKPAMSPRIVCGHCKEEIKTFIQSITKG